MFPVRGLEDSDAVDLSRTFVAGPLDERVRDRIVAEAHGNPLARGSVAVTDAPGFLAVDLVVETARHDRVESNRALRSGWSRYQHQCGCCSWWPRLTLLTDPVLVWQAAEALGSRPTPPSRRSGASDSVREVDVWFSHPLIRSGAKAGGNGLGSPGVHREPRSNSCSLTPIAAPGTSPMR